MAHPTTARITDDRRREAIGDDPIPRRQFDEDRSFALGAYAPDAIEADNILLLQQVLAARYGD